MATAGAGLGDGEQQPFESDQLSRRETLELVRAYYRISDPLTRKRVFELVKAIGGTTRRRGGGGSED